MAGGHGSVHSVERSGANHFEGYIEVEVLFLHIVHQTLEVEQSGVAFVAVIELGLDAEFFEHQHAADTEHIFLLDAVFPVATIKLVSDLTVEVAVSVEVCIEQIEFHTAYVHAPDVGINEATTGEGHVEHHGVAIVVQHRFDGELVEVLCFVVSDLLAVNAQ